MTKAKDTGGPAFPTPDDWSPSGELLPGGAGGSCGYRAYMHWACPIYSSTKESGEVMTPEQKLKWAVLAKVAAWRNKPLPDYPCDNVDELYDSLVEAEDHWDGVSETRCGQAETGLKCEWSRHYESKSVAMQMPDGSWVGWTYWYGGGKHGEPEAIDWMDSAYDVACKEEEKVVVVRTFTQLEATP